MFGDEWFVELGGMESVEGQWKSGKQMTVACFMNRQLQNDTEDTEEDYGLIRPSLIKQLRSILDQYPDDGQILKELLQNAEDAGATEAKFLYDDNCVISADRLFIIDPHEKFFQYKGDSTSGYSWHLKQKQKELSKISDQFRPYINKFECTQKTFQNGFYGGTLFRFPLRTVESELSTVVYDTERMMQMFKMFEAEAPLILLFLKHLESIQLYQRSSGEEDPELLYEVRMKPDCLDYIRKMREDFLVRCRASDSSEGISLNYVLSVETLKYGMDGCVDKTLYRWLINEYKAGKNVSAQLRTLQNDPSLNLIPLIGVALAVDRPEHDKNQTSTDIDTCDDDELAMSDSLKQVGLSKPDGQVFCFLPLPIEQKTPTGLPVHVNGYFAISQNRRHLKWPTKGNDVCSDNSILWNQCLLQELLPISYAELLLYGTHLALSTSIVSPEDIYYAIPDLVSVDQKWQFILENLFDSIFQHPVIYTKLGGGQWAMVESVVFSWMREDAETTRIVSDILVWSGLKVASIPKHLLHALGAFSQRALDIISPAVVRAELKKTPELCQKLKTRSDHLLLLRYCLKDEDFRDIIGIQLLPLADKRFVTFVNHGEVVYLPTNDAPRDLFPGLESCLIPDDLDDLLKFKLSKVADEGLTQLRYIDKEAVATLIPRVIPLDYNSKDILTIPRESCPLSVGWLVQFWTYLRKEYPTDIRVFSGLPVLPLNRTAPLQLVPLTLNGPCIMKSAMGVELDVDLVHVLDIFGIHVIKELPDYVQSHAAVIGNFVRLPFKEDIIDLFHKRYLENRNGDQLLCCFQRDASAPEKRAMIQLIAGLKVHSLSPSCRMFLRKLPVFPSTQCTQENGDFVSVESVPEGADMSALPCSVSKRLINTADSHVASAAKALGVHILDEKHLLETFIFSDIKEGKHDADTIQLIVSPVFSRFSEFMKAESFIKAMADINFVPTDNGLLKKARELMDPSDELLIELVAEEEGMFPAGVYAEPHMVLCLHQLGLKTCATITSDDLLLHMFKVKDLSNSQETIERAVKKGKALLNLLCHRPDLLWEQTQNRMLMDWASDIPWVPVLQDRPALYPNSLSWFSEGVTVKPSAVSCLDYVPLTGSVKATFDGEVNRSLKDIFGWSELPQLNTVVSHLNNIIQQFLAKEKAKFLAILTGVYDYLMQKNMEEVHAALKRASLDNWIWHGDGFASLESVVGESTFTDLTPYVYWLPSEMMAFRNLFESQGLKKCCSPERMVHILHQIADDAGHYGTGDYTLDKLLQLAVNILNYLRDQPLTERCKKNILVPAMCQDATMFKMLPVKSCTYCDVDWIRQGFDLMEFDEQDGIVFIHRNLPIPTAEKLGVPTLMSRMLHAEELAITGFGQGEPLTARLKQLLDDYTDGLAVFKEMIQNADDAGATEINFMYDERANEANMKYLIDEGMRSCQGPALWIHNNAVFTDEDFVSITKLGGATKELKSDKIGTFGLGFNVVYNITDVPSFISRNSIVFFDPHTTHLGKGIKDRSRPGIRIDMTKNKTLLKKLSDQFQPYKDIFGCSVEGQSGESYDGTLFRLPLRTKQQAANSEISSLHYDSNEVLALFNLFIKHAHNLLLFTQNLQKIGLHHIAVGGTALDAKEVFVLEKDLLKLLRHESAISNKMKAGSHQKMAFLQAATKYFNAVSKPVTGRLLSVPQVPQLSALIQTTATVTANQLDLPVPKTDSNQYWLISFSVGHEKSKRLALKSKGTLMPVGGIAVHLKKVDRGFIPANISELGKGLAFCFLPLPIASGLPVHINALFALESSRKHLSQRADDEKEDFKAEWNESLLEDAIVDAYVQALWDLKQVLPFEQKVSFYDVWPVFSFTEAYFQPLVTSFYKNMSTLLQMPLCSRNGVIISLSNAVFLDLPSSTPSEIATFLVDAFSQCSDGYHVLTPPDYVIRSFVATGYESLLAEKHYNLERFYEEVFFPNINALESSLRDKLVVYALAQNRKNLNVLLRTHKCIPSSPDGKTLKRVEDLVYPTGLASRLYVPEDGRFPHGEHFVNGNVLSSLQQLGLKVNDVSWADLVERANSVQDAFDIDETLGRTRLHNVLAFIDRKLLQSTPSLHSYRAQLQASTADDDKMLASCDSIKNISFLPVLRKPDIYPISWKADELKLNELVSSCELYSHEARYLVSATQLIVNEEHMTRLVKEFFGFAKKVITIEQVMTQLEHVLIVDIQSLNDTQKYEELHKILYAIYAYVQDLLKVDRQLADQICRSMKERPCILVGDQFLVPAQLAMNFQYDCSPYLYAIPPDILRKFKPLMINIGVKDNFSTKEYVEVLQQLHKESDGKVLDSRQLDVSLRVTTELNNTLKLSGSKVTEAADNFGEIYIPDAKGILQPSRYLCYNDCPWIKDPQVTNFTHPDITYNTSACLGVKTKRQETLSKYAKGIPFGQKEQLTNSLKRILHTYPCDHEILKELIQNADDAGATEIHFIRDSRQHSKEHVFDNSWKPLQGPALCVYNNQPFTRADLEGIQKLGEGSKNRDPSKTGQYGIGFSSVYHLTDVPSLLTTSRDMGKMLCVFDPHCLYVPGASPAEPGMMYENVDQLETAFQDVFGCYLTDKFDVNNGTMFRLPLRTSEMADRSKISKEPITLSKVHSMLEKLKHEAFDILLFMNYLTEIKISDIDPLTGNLVNTYNVRLILSETQRQLRHCIANQVKEWSKMVKDGSASFTDIERQESVYTAYINDTVGRQEKWSISQVVGFEDGETVPDNVQDAFDNGNLVLMPRGGVACLLEERINGKPINSNKSMSAFCFLPLPIRTGLPVQVNSHFSLGHENRRHLWTKGDSTTDYQKAWNDLMCSTIVAEAYVNLLKHIRMHCLMGTLENDKAMVTCTRQILDSAIDTYISCFPLIEATLPEWQDLAKNVYMKIAKHHAPILPAVQECPSSDISATNLQSTQWSVSWMSPVGEGADKAFFIRSEAGANLTHQTSSFLSRFTNMFKVTSHKHVRTDAQILREVLLACGLRLVEAPLTLVENFIASGVTIDFMSPDGVITFLQSYSSETSCCKIGALPNKLNRTPFGDVKQLNIVIQYCKLERQFGEKLHGLPLLLTEDGMLRTFDIEKPVFCSAYADLIPERGELFLNRLLLDSVFKVVNLFDWPVFKKFDITELSSILTSKLPVALLRSGKPVEWDKQNSSLPSEAWMKRLWTMIREETKPSLVYISSDKAKADVERILSPLDDWCFLPAKATIKSYLFPLSDAAQVIHYTQTDSRWYGIRSILQKFGIPELDIAAINADVAKCIVTTFDKPCTVLKLLHTHLVGKETAIPIPKLVADQLLEYFVRNISELQEEEENASALRDLPFYTTICGHQIALTDCIVYTLPSKIPTDGIDIWQNESGTVFLERNDDFQALYDYLGCAKINVVDVYSQFIFQHLEYFPEDDRMIHLYHVYSRYLKTGTGHLLSAAERDNLLGVLNQMPFVDCGSGDLQLASEFYDPNNVVFKVMLPEDRFAPVPRNSPFRESEWYDFLGKLGLIRELNREMFVQFANQVACEGHIHDKTVALAKSKVLVQHLYGMSRSSRSAILPEISEIQFVAQADASANLTKILPQYGDVGVDTLHFTSFRNSISKKHEKLIWTQVALLPEWASPFEQHRLQPDDIQEIMEGLKLQNAPPLEMVVRHLLALSHHIGDLDQRVNQLESKIIREIFTDIYRYLRNNAMNSANVKDMLSDEPIVLVSDGELVKPCQTVVNLYEADEIKPFLLKIPLHFGEFVPFLKHVGATETVSVVQLASVLESFKKKIGISRCSPNELKGVLKAVKGLLEALENNAPRDIDVPVLYLPNEAGRLVDASKLVYNDVPSFYDRVKQFGIQFVADLRECGLKSRHADELLALLPQRVRPVMLSALVREELTEECRQTESKEGLARVLHERVRSEVFLSAMARLVRHQAHKTGQKVNEKYMYHILDRLSTIHISGVDKVITHLTFKRNHIDGSEIEEACFVEKRQGPKTDICEWLLYIQKDSSLKHDLLVPLAGVINSILSGMLHDSVLYLLPILSCPEKDVHSKLNSLNIRLDRVQSVSRISLLPELGSEVEEELREQLKWGEVGFETGEYVGYKPDPESGIIHAMIREEVMSPRDNRVYLLDVGHEQNAIIVEASQLFKFNHS
ncbi:hypothetical protein LSH36_125g03013 [Paralvinella palmiformis]|uniref:Sacsin/Nov domain-containing protein n=1 Tax=Paralvinella palmiformis TaxID=53620 RepID=A0AAD9N8M3_9ANNE|nr:hypothetical protein LSH36_125g03013 [Paralvinella palmiformis]